MTSIDAALNVRVLPPRAEREATYGNMATACILLAIAAIGIAVSLYVGPPVLDAMLIGP